MEYIPLIITSTISLCSFIVALVSFSSKKKQNDNKEGKEIGSLFTEIGYIKAGIDDIKTEQVEQRKTNVDMAVRLTCVEDRVEEAHRRITRLEGVSE